MDWQPIGTAPTNTRVLVCSEKGYVQIARLALRWYDDADSLIGRRRWWMPLPAATENADVPRTPRAQAP